MRVFRMMRHAAVDRRWKFFFVILRKTVYGLTHWSCKQCSGYKGLSTSSRCESCLLENIWWAIHNDTTE